MPTCKACDVLLEPHEYHWDEELKRFTEYCGRCVSEGREDAYSYRYDYEYEHKLTESILQEYISLKGGYVKQSD